MHIGIKSAKILTPEGFIHGNLGIKDHKIIQVGQQVCEQCLTFPTPVYVLPGFIDEHIHGAMNADSMDNTFEALTIIAKALAKEGTTSFLPTTMTQKKSLLMEVVSTISNYMDQNEQPFSEVLGIHLEGPFINKKSIGAQSEEHVIPPNIEDFKLFESASKNRIKKVTLAPEIRGGNELIRYLTSKDIIASLGHSEANYQEVQEAIKCGANSITHCYNAMSPLHHRDIGLVGAALLHDDLYTELIADGVHVSNPAMKLLYKNTKGTQRLTLITDSMRAKGLCDGIYDLGGQPVYVDNKTARLRNGVLAGGVLSMLDAVKYVIKVLDITLEEAVKLASEHPAKKLGVYDRKGSIEVGKDADLVILDENFELQMTICRGKIAYDKSEEV
jgi:N-acetylglucosamine-6-phosphate deacetylase